MRFLTGGESHGKLLSVIIEGIPAGIPVDKDFILSELQKRDKCFGRSSRMEIEKEAFEIFGGVRKGLSTGAPLVIVIPNNEFGSLSQERISELQTDIWTARPGHADLSGAIKFGFEETRNVIERASGRETAARVAVGAIAKMFLSEFGVSFASAITQVKNISSSKKITFKDAKNLKPDFPFADPQKLNEAIEILEDSKKKGETVGGKVWVGAKGVVPGIGSYTNWDKRLDAQIGYHLMSIPSVKGVLIGDIEKAVLLDGSNAQDQLQPDAKPFYKRKTNLAGGIEGGVSNGEIIEATLFVKPLSSSKFSKAGLNLRTKKIVEPQIPRTDTTSLAPVAVISESLMAIVLMNNYLEKFGSDSLKDIKTSFLNYRKRLMI